MDFNSLIKAYLAGKRPVYFETITFTDAAAVGLDILAANTAAATAANAVDAPKKVYIAEIVLEADHDETNAVKAAHFRVDGAALPTAASGMPLGNGSVYELQGYEQIRNFRIIGVTGGLTHTLQVTYYTLADQ